jgi:hypothetical protein
LGKVGIFGILDLNAGGLMWKITEERPRQTWVWVTADDEKK